MTHVIFPEFKNDAFVSYARDDDRRVGGMDGWVTRVLSELGALLPTYGGDRLNRVSFDRDDLVASGELRGMIQQEIDGSGVFLMFLSASYLRSPYCLLEFNHLLSRSDFSPQRVLIIERDNCLAEHADRILGQSQPADRPVLEQLIRFAKDQRRFLFWENVLGETRLLGLEFKSDHTERAAFMRQIDELARGLAKTVRILQAAGAAAPPPAQTSPLPAPAAGKAQVFVALAPDELRSHRDQILSRLAKRNDCQIYPIESTTLWPRLRDAKAFEAEITPIIGALKAPQSLFVQLIGSGVAAEGGLPESYIEMQFRMARESGAQMMILRNLNREIDEFCPADARIFKNAPTIDETVPSFLNRLDAAIGQLLAMKPRPQQTSASLVFLNAAPEDRLLAHSVAEQLKGQFEFLLPSDSAAESKVAAEEAEESYEYCDEAVLLRVAAPPSWTNAQLRRLARVRHRRERPFRHIAVVQHKANASKPSVLVQGLVVSEFEGAPVPERVASQVAGILR